MDLALILYRISGWSQDIVWLVICWMILKRRWYWHEYKAFFMVYALAICIFELIYAVSAIALNNNLFLDYIYAIVEFVLLSFFLKGIIRQVWVSYFVSIASLLFTSFEIFNAFWGQGYKNYNSYGALINNIYLIFLSGFSLFLLAKRHINKKLFSITESWLVIGIFLIYTSIMIFDYIYGLAVPYQNDALLYTVLIAQNFLKTFFLFFYINGIQRIST